MTILKIHHLCFDYNTGMVTGLLGPNALGKTTSFKCMNDILHPRVGQVCLSGLPVVWIPRKDLA